MRFIILGMGAVGSLWASQLYLNGHQVYGLCRGQHYTKIKKNGLKFKNLTGKMEPIEINTNFNVFNKKSEAKSFFDKLTSDDCIMISSKAYSLKVIINEFKEEISNHGAILLLQNGIGNEEIVRELLYNVDIYRATTTYGAFLKTPGFIENTGAGFTKIGYPNINKDRSESEMVSRIKKIKKIAQVFSECGLKTEFTTNIDLILWEKIFVNIGINALGTIHNITNGELLENNEIKQKMRDGITEAWKVAKLKNIDVEEEASSYIDLTFDVAKKTAPNRNSMLQDISNGKPTEIDFINGKILNYAEKLGIEAPVNKELTTKIRKLEQEVS